MSQRMEQINSTLQKDIAKYAVKQLESSDYIITVVYVLTTPDLSEARVGITTFPKMGSHLKSAIATLRKDKSELQLQLARQHKLKNIPILKFEVAQEDDSINRVDKLLQDISNE